MKGLDSYGKEYKDIVSKYQEQIENAFNARAVTRLSDIKKEAQEELTDAKEKVSDEKQELKDGHTKLKDAEQQIEEGKIKIADAKSKLANAKKELEDGQKEYEENKALFEEQITDGKNQLDIGGNQLAAGQAEIDENRKKIKKGQEQVDDGLKQIEENEATLTEQKNQMVLFLDQTKQVIQIPISLLEQEQKNALIQAGSAISLSENQSLGDLWMAYFAGGVGGETIVSTLEGIISQIENGLSSLADAKNELLQKKKELDLGLQQLNSAQDEVNKGNDTIIEKSREFEAAKADGESQLADAKQKLDNGWADYEEGVRELAKQEQKLIDAENEYEDGLIEFNEKEPDAKREIADAEHEIADAEEELADLKEPIYYAFSREDNPGYSEYGDNGNRLSSLAIVFPAFFFAIAALVSLTTVTRMIEEQRVQIGTLKAQGYTDLEISLKYYVYALGASGLGAIFGLLGGFYGIPRIIISAYHSMYVFPNEQYAWYWWVAMTSIGIAVFCTGISVWAVLRQELKGTPAILMRPKAPKIGKRILLERITPIWKR